MRDYNYEIKNVCFLLNVETNGLKGVVLVKGSVLIFEGETIAALLWYAKTVDYFYNYNHSRVVTQEILEEFVTDLDADHFQGSEFGNIPEEIKYCANDGTLYLEYTEFMWQNTSYYFELMIEKQIQLREDEK